MTKAIRDAAQALYAACCGYGSMREQDIRDAAKALGAALAAPEPTDDEAIEALIEGSDGAWHEDQFRIDAGMPVVAMPKPTGTLHDDGYCSDYRPNGSEKFYSEAQMRDAQAAIAARDARIAEHASDGEMLDWLVRKGTMHVGGSDARGWMVSDMRNGLVILSRGHATYRDAIRAAMKGTPS